MSKIARKPTIIPDGVTIVAKDGSVTLKGSKGELTRKVPACIKIKIDDSGALVERADESRQSAIMLGTMSAHLKNMVKGVTEGFEKTLILEGVGYRAQAGKDSVNLSLGFSHPIDYKVREGVTVKTPEPTKMIISGNDIEAVGQVSAELRSFKPPEPYKGKGIRYEGEHIRRKAGKAAAK